MSWGSGVLGRVLIYMMKLFARVSDNVFYY